ncbi:DUF63 family protein [Halostella pelagica]|uniref:DUF63 family protein n=1 Tax=Halostella pelagica TaxID=2583824 RepID=UPI0010800E9A|nr:DUF63 family protein [Halostella pelagica]
MDEVLDKVDPERAWAALVASIVAVFGLGSVLFHRTVYVEFIWHYFWGPVYADSEGASCVAWADGQQRLLDSSECASLQNNPDRLADIGPVAEPGYTLVSEVGYVVVLLVALVGVMFLLRRLDIQRYRTGFYALFPFMLFGGALRVVEDANVAAIRAGVDQPISYPLNTLLISPLIYFTMFFFTLAAVVVAVQLDSRGYVDGFEYPLAGIGTAALLSCVGYLGYLAGTAEYVYFHPQVLAVVLVGATLAAGLTWVAIDRFAPEVNRGTGLIGLVLIWGHAIDGVANVVGLDWAAELGVHYGDLGPKHPVNEAIVNVTGAVLPASITHYTGTAWPFLLVKLVAIVLVVWIFDENVFEDSPRYTVMLLITVLAVGLGPGTRDMLRATFGI